MPPRAGVTKERVLDTATEIANADGVESVTLARLAKELGVKTPSLYAHVGGLEHVHQQLKLRGVEELTERMQRAAVGRAGSDALKAIADAQREYARERPGLWGATVRLAPEDPEEIHRAAEALLGVVLSVLRGYGLEGEDALHATRCLRAATRGFIDLELAGGFGMPLAVDESWRRLIEMIDRGLSSAGPTAGR